MGTNKGIYHDPWANLACAIIRAGEQAHDITFLNSEWCKDLKELCKLDSELHDRNIIQNVTPKLKGKV